MHVRRLMFAVAAASLGAMAGAAHGGNPYGGGTRITGPAPAEIPTGAMSKDDKARIVTIRFAACLIKARRSAAMAAIQPEPWEADAGGKLLKIVDSRCLESGELKMPTNLLRGALYQVLYREKFPDGPPALPPSAIDFTAKRGGSFTDEEKTEIALRQFGDCVARRDINDAHAMIMSIPGSSAETAALKSLVPHFSPCIVQGSKWTLNRNSVAAILSEVLYREGVAGSETASN